jgi:hypothetical protein
MWPTVKKKEKDVISSMFDLFHLVKSPSLASSVFPLSKKRGPADVWCVIFLCLTAMFIFFLVALEAAEKRSHAELEEQRAGERR